MLIDQLLVREVSRLKDILANGLPDCYNDFQDYLFDFFPDFVWGDKEQFDRELAALLASDEWCALADSIKTKFGYDFKCAVSESNDD